MTKNSKPGAKRSGEPSRPRGKANEEKVSEAILNAAIGEFFEHGFGGARVDAIARRAKTNKRYLYVYVGNKEAIWLAALQRVYQIMRAGERELNLENLPPDEGMRQLIHFNFWFHVKHPEFISMLNDENRQKARNLRRSTTAQKMYLPLLVLIEGLLRRGQEAGLFRSGVDPVQLYISIAALSYFYCSNQHTLSVIFGQDLGGQREMQRREEHVVSVIMGYLAHPSKN
ncbi:MAG TPA: TetR/AcrR family transcriptional regulator [Rhizomicrobium sp.]|nr:TetR/AcrR family transcriptional regulator [Rhizomicrobium sp.]